MKKLPNWKTSFTSKLSEQVQAVEESRDKRLADLEAQSEAIEKRYDEELASNLEPVIKEGQRLEDNLASDMGSAPRKPIVFSATETVIVQAGETITQKHISDCAGCGQELSE